MSNFTLMFVAKKDNPSVVEAFNDYQEKVGIIKKVAVPGKREYEAVLFAKKLARSFPSIEQAKKFIENNY